MIRNLLLALAASLLPCASAAQTVTSPTLIPGTSPAAPKALKLVSYAPKVTPPVKKNTAVFGPCNDAAPFAYSLTASCPAAPVLVPVTPPVLTASTGGAVALANREAFILTDKLAIGINEGGGFGSITDAPAGYDLGTNYKRVGIGLREHKTDLTILGANVEGFSVGGDIAGKRTLWRNLRGVGRMEVPGTFAANGTWTGEANGLRIEQRVHPEGIVTSVDVHLTNTGAATIAGMRYMRTADFDDLAPAGTTPSVSPLKTANRLVGKADVQSGLLGRGKPLVAFLRSDDATATATIGGFINEDPFAVPSLAPSTADASVNLVWLLGDLAPGASVNLSFQIGAR